VRRWLASVAAVAVTAFLIVAFVSGRTEKVERVALLMDTPVRVVAYGPRERAIHAADAVLAEVARLEGLWHPTRPGSDVVRLNASAGIAPVRVAPETATLVAAALEVAEASGGAYDPTIGPLVKAWGFGGEQHRIPSDAERAAARALIDWRAVRVDRAAGTVYLEKPGMALDLGGIAKGYAASVCRAVLDRQGIRAGLVQLGGSVAVLGKRPGDARGAWQVAVAHPRKPEGFLTVLSLDKGFVDTAGDYQRYFEQDGVRYHHILDPSTGMPARGVASVTVLTDRGEWADAYATAAFVMGMERGYTLLSSHFDTIMVSAAGEAKVTPALAGLRLDVAP